MVLSKSNTGINFTYILPIASISHIFNDIKQAANSVTEIFYYFTAKNKIPYYTEYLFSSMIKPVLPDVSVIFLLHSISFSQNKYSAFIFP